MKLGPVGGRAPMGMRCSFPPCRCGLAPVLYPCRPSVRYRGVPPLSPPVPQQSSTRPPAAPSTATRDPRPGSKRSRPPLPTASPESWEPTTAAPSTAMIVAKPRTVASASAQPGRSPPPTLLLQSPPPLAPPRHALYEGTRVGEATAIHRRRRHGSRGRCVRSATRFEVTPRAPAQPHAMVLPVPRGRWRAPMQLTLAHLLRGMGRSHGYVGQPAAMPPRL